MGLHVIVVEDELLIAMQMDLLLRALGHEVVGIATTRQEAVTLARETHPDMALMDLQLARGSSGIDAARGLYELAEIRSLFVSAMIDDAARAAVAPFQPLGFVGKPFLVSTLRRALDRAAPMLRGSRRGYAGGSPSRHPPAMRA